MSRSVKPKNNDYIDSSGIVYNREQLNNIIIIDKFNDTSGNDWKEMLRNKIDYCIPLFTRENQTIILNGGWQNMNFGFAMVTKIGTVYQIVWFSSSGAYYCRKSGNEYYFDFQCYSSESQDVDYGEPIVKDATHTSTMGISFFSSPKDIEILSTLEMDCTPENGVNGFKIYQERDNSNNFILNKENYCKPTKSSFVSKKDIKTQEKIATSINLDCFVDILVGSTETETEDIIGYPLRSFQFKIEGTSTKRNCYYIYSYSKLKNMGKLKDQRHKQFADLRNKNTQVD
jgi:hypothetical protein